MAPSRIGNAPVTPGQPRSSSTEVLGTTTVNDVRGIDGIDETGDVQHHFEVGSPTGTSAVSSSVQIPGRPAEDYMKPLDHGFWSATDGPRGHDVVRGYLDFEVSNYEFHKRMAVKISVTRENGAVEEFLYRPKYKGKLPNGKERWGTDDIRLFPNSGPHGKIKHVDVSYLVQADTDGDHLRDLCVSEHAYRLADYKDLTSPSNKRGSLKVSGANDDFGSHEIDTAGKKGTSLSFKDTLPPVEVYFAPYDNPERVVMAEIDKVIQAQLDDPNGRHTIHASVFNINDKRIADKLIEAHQAGVEVKLLSAAHQMTPEKHYQEQYQRLQKAGVEVIGVVNPEKFGSNHTKFAVFDGKVVTTGSYNWETRSAEDNSENMMVIRSPEVASVYEDMFSDIGGGLRTERPVDPTSKINVFYSQQHDVPKLIYDELEKAQDNITISMFTLRSLKFQDGNQQKDVLDALVKAQERGVKVTVLLEENIADAGEYYGRTTDNDLTDEFLASKGIETVKIHTNYNNNKYAAMHHKFAVIDGTTTLTGAYNWYSGSQVSDDDLVLVRDKGVAQQYLGEVTNLRAHYDEDFDRENAPQTPMTFSVHHPHTYPGDSVYLVGNIPELGEWDSKKAVRLDPSDWPNWKVDLDIPSGVHFEYKLMVRNFHGTFWEPGANREHTASPDGNNDIVQDTFR